MPPLAVLPKLDAADVATLAWAAVVTAALVALHRRLGRGEAITGSLAAWSAALLLWLPPQPAVQARLLVGLAFVTLAVGRLLRERDPTAAPAAWALCGLSATAAAATSLGAGPADAATDIRRWVTPIGLLVLAIFAPRTPAGPLALYALAAYGVLLARHCGPASRAAAGLNSVAMVLAAVALLVLLADLTVRWDRRRRAWERDPSRPPTPVPAARSLYAALLTLALIAAILTGVGHTGPLAALTAFIAALVCFVAGHVCGWKQAGVLGLLLVAETIVLAATAIGGAGAYTFATGSILAAGWLLWIARFWEQQLLDGRPWTTAGKLIEPARMLARLATLAGAAGVWSACGPGRTVSLPAGLVLVALIALLARMFLRDARTPGRTDSAWAGLLLVATITLPAYASATRLEVVPDVSLAVWLALAGLGLAVPGALRRLGPVRCVVGSAAPAAAVAYALHARDLGSIIAAGLAMVAAGLTLCATRSDAPVRGDTTSS